MRVLSTVTLTTTQKRVIAKTLASPTPKVAGEAISGDENMITARDQLAKLGVIEYIGGEVNITEKGQALAKDENIIDDSGQLTDDGNALAYDDEQQPDSGIDPQPLNASYAPKHSKLTLLQGLIRTSQKNQKSKWLADSDTNVERPLNTTPDISSFKNFLKS
jgi:hypothetical protein